MKATQLTMRRSKLRRVGLLLCCWLWLTAATPQPKNILFLGDSITAGYGLEPSQSYPALIQDKIDAKKWPFRTVNAGQNGDTSAGGVNRMDWLLRSQVDVLVLELGGNDGLRGLPPETTRQNLQAIIERTQKKYPQAKIILAGMQVPPNMGADYAKKFAIIYPELAKKNKALLIPFILENVGGVRELNLPDGIHPTAKGQEIVAANVWKILEPVLQSLISK
ncbi:MAG: arylesterase [Candidatus Binatia bacterium]